MTPAQNFSSTPARLRAAWWGVVARFLVHGLIVSTWVSRIAGVKQQLHLSDGQLGFALLGAAIGSVASIPMSGYSIPRYGARRIVAVSTIGFCLALVLPALATGTWTLFLALLIYGFAAGTNDVSMNANAVGVEKLLGKPTISRFHAMFSIGAMAGSFLGGTVAARSVSPLLHLLCASGLLMFGTLVTAPLLIETEDDAAPAAKLRLRAVPGTLLLVAAIGFCFFLSEGAVADWTSVYFFQVLHSGPGFAASAYAVFSVSMSIFRLVGDAITASIGRASTVRWGSMLAAVGIGSMLLAREPYWALPGLVLAGAGYSSIIPLTFAAGGRVRGIDPGVGVATVSGIGYLGFLVGPPVIGALSEMTNLRVGLSLLVVLAGGAAALVGTVERRGGDSSPW